MLLKVKETITQTDKIGYLKNTERKMEGKRGIIFKKVGILI